MEQLKLFDTDTDIPKVASRRQIKSTSYESFVDKFKPKFKPKLTTDDCYTPVPVFNIILDYVKEKFNVNESQIVRPFFPGGDFENFDYPENCVVVDNPPFSIATKIKNFFVNRNIKFFLFANHLTIFNLHKGVTCLVVGAPVIYANGANVNTSFVTNLFDESIGIKTDFELTRKLNELNKKKPLQKYSYPSNLVTVSSLMKMEKSGCDIEIKKESMHFVRKLVHSKEKVFGGGFLITDKVAKELEELEELKKLKKLEELEIIPISETERQIIEQLK